MKKLLVFIFLVLFLNSCANKNEKLSINKDEYIFIKYSNETKKSFDFKEELEKELQKRAFKIDIEKKATYKIFLNTIFANETMRKSASRSFLENVDLGISIGHVFGNVGISGKVGTKVKDLIGEKYDEKVFEVVVEIDIKDQNNQTLEYSTVVAQAVLDNKSYKELIPKLEKEVALKVVKILNN